MPDSSTSSQDKGVTDEPSNDENQTLEPPEKKMRCDDTGPISAEDDERIFQCTVCKNRKTSNFFPSILVFQEQQICKCCIGGLIGSEHYPSCRICGKIGKCGCNHQKKPLKKCTKCEQMKNRDSFLDEDWFSEEITAENSAKSIPRETTCMDCLSNKKNKLVQQWMEDRSVVFRLMRYGIQMFDCDSFLNSPSLRNFRVFPSMEDVLGKYDVLFTKWETDNLGPYSASDYGDYLLKRVMTGSVELQSEQSHGEGYESLVGKVLFDDAKYYEDDDLICECPFGSIVSFRFSGDDNIYVTENTTSVQADGADESCSVAAMGNIEEMNGIHDFDHISERSSFQGSYGSQVELKVIARSFPFDWIPRDYYRNVNPYAKFMRQEISKRRSRKTNWSHSWLSSHMNLPETIIQLIYDFITFIPDANFTVEQDDILITLNFNEYDCALKVNVIARRRQ